MNLKINYTEISLRKIEKSLAQFLFNEDIKLIDINNEIYDDIIQDLNKQLEDDKQNLSRQIDNILRIY